MPKRATCSVVGCYHPTIDSVGIESHNKTYHGPQHIMHMPGHDEPVTLVRNTQTLLLACPCGAPAHSRYSMYKMKRLVEKDPHPEPNESPYPDDPDLGRSVGRKPKKRGGKGKGKGKMAEAVVVAEGLDDEATGSMGDGGIDFTDDAVEPSGDLGTTSQGDGLEQGPSDDDDVEWERGSDVDSDEERVYLDERPMLDRTSEEAQEAERRLGKYHLYVDPTYNRIICDICHSLIPFERVHRHAEKHTVGRKKMLLFEHQIPREEEVFLGILRKLDGHQPVDLGTSPIPPFEGIPIQEGYKCMVVGCNESYRILPSRRAFRRHFETFHPERTLVQDRPFQKVPSQVLSKYTKEMQMREVTYLPTVDVDVFQAILEHNQSVGLGQVSSVYELSKNTHERGLVYSYTDWDHMIKGVDISVLRRTCFPPTKESEPELVRLLEETERYYEMISQRLKELDLLTLRTIASPEPQKEIVHAPFRRSQEDKTVLHNAQFMAYFLIFLIRHLKHPVPSFEVSLHSSTLESLVELQDVLSNSTASEESVFRWLHQSVWTLLSEPSLEALRNAQKDPFTMFLVVYHLHDDQGTASRPTAYPHNISRAQWSFRATACWYIIQTLETSNRGGHRIYMEDVSPWIHEGRSHLFNSLRQNTHLLSTLSLLQPNLPKFTYNVSKTVLSYDGFPLNLEEFYAGLRQKIKTAEGLLSTLLRGLSLDEMMRAIDERLNPSQGRTAQWFRDSPLNVDFGFSLGKIPGNGLEVIGNKLLHHLSKDSDIVQKVRGSVQAQDGLWRWFGQLDDFVAMIFCLASTSWGGGLRGTECDHLAYANHRAGPRNMFMINNILTFVVSYSKNRNIHGAGKMEAHSPSYQVSRLLLAMLFGVYPAAAHLATISHIAREMADNYLSYVFVQSGKVMDTKEFTKALSQFTHDIFGREMGVRDYRQVMCSLLVNMAHVDFGKADEDDIELQAIHASYGHSLETGNRHYGVQTNDSLQAFPHTAIASHQRVCFRWHSCIGQIHPLLAKELTSLDADHTTLLTQAFKDIDRWLTSKGASLAVTVKEELERANTKLIGDVESHLQAMGPFIAQEVVRSLGGGRNVELADRSHTLHVHPRLLDAVSSLIPYKGPEGPSWTCPEQAQLVQSCLQDDHVLAIMPTGSGKTLGIFGATLLYSTQLFLVVVPLTALVQDLMRRLSSTTIQAGVYPDVDGATAQIAIVPSHLVGRDSFLEWGRACESRIQRIFMDEAHLIYLSDFREEFPSLVNLISLQKPITFLSATVFPRSVDVLCEWMSISRPLLHVIRSSRPRTNIQYTVQRMGGYVEIEAAIQALVHQIRLEEQDRGLIYCKTVGLVKQLSSKIGLPSYYSKMSDDVVVNNEMKEQRHQRWRDGVVPEERWMVATMGFGQGIDYASVRYVIHCEVHGLVHFVQEVGRAGRDGLLAHSHVFYSEDPGFRGKPQGNDGGNENPGEDHSGKGEMKRFLETKGCRRLEFFSLEGVGQSCASLPRGSPFCDNCLRLLSEPGTGSLRTLSRPEFYRPIVPPLSESGSRTKRIALFTPQESIARGEKRSKTSALTVKKHGAVLDGQFKEAEKEMEFLKKVVDEVVSFGCAHCWIKRERGTDHDQHDPPFFDVLLRNLRNARFDKFQNWPLCYFCWLPFRSVFGHPSFEAGTQGDKDSCPHADVIEYLLPTVIGVIWLTLYQEKGNSKLKKMEIGMGLSNWRESHGKSENAFAKWLKEPPISRAQLPHPVKFVNAFYREFMC